MTALEAPRNSLVDFLTTRPFQLAARLVSRATDPRPEWTDSAAVNGPVNLFNLPPQVFGIAIRRNISWGYVDPEGAKTTQQARELELYNFPYHVPYFDQPFQAQLDKWLLTADLDPVRPMPRAIDMELQRGVPTQQIADFMWQACEYIEQRDGFFPIIYSRYMLVEDWLASWTDDMFNSVWWWLARYLVNRAIEHPGPPIPDDALPQLDRSRVILHQTADKAAPYPGVLLPPPQGSYAMDRDRWELGDASQMHAFIAQTWGGTTPPPEPPPDPCALAMVVTANTLNVRSGPSTSFPVQYQLSNGFVTTISDIHVTSGNVWGKLPDNNWSAIVYNGNTYMERVG